MSCWPQFHRTPLIANPINPVSTTASILTIIGAGAAVHKSLRKLRGLCHAPAAVLELQEGLTELEEIVEEESDIARCHKEVI